MFIPSLLSYFPLVSRLVVANTKQIKIKPFMYSSIVSTYAKMSRPLAEVINYSYLDLSDTQVIVNLFKAKRY